MIERKFVSQKIKEHKIQEYISENLKNVGHSHTRMLKTPLGEKIVIYASRPGLIVGRKGQNIKDLTKTLKSRFELENPQIEISEVEGINLDASIVAERITGSLERFGGEKFKAVGHKTMEAVMNSGALGVEIIVSGKIPSSRAKSWRFYSGYLKKCGDISIVGVSKAHAQAKLKTGVVGIKVSIMPPGTKLPDKVELNEEKEENIEEIKEEEAKDVKKGGEEKEVKEEPKKAEKDPNEKSKKKRVKKDES
ncbi:30S ribosomal protein S3 [archaeon]|jgi:small subunit ribosomal protein S3|nr:30S ribosomal protein S3 [archaeon]MDP6548263.1 30S ribosomal protein S3 [Candidatus Woesearchaeota archaeon]|tara:strand:+ start:13206 stop:13955 length:750 start_codon:yes stop_codon:yes gene_type:complete